MDRASDYGSEGWGFKSLRAHQNSPVYLRNLITAHVGVLTGVLVEAHLDLPPRKGFLLTSTYADTSYRRCQTYLISKFLICLF